MRVDPPFKVWPGILPAAYCDDVIRHAETLERMSGSVSHDPKGQARSSDVAWISDNAENAWVFNPIANLVAATNRKFWGWTMTGRETIQYAEYTENQFYEWHMDAQKKPYPVDGRWGGLARKISVSVNLSYPADYDGGDFEIEDTTPTPNRQESRVQSLSDLRQKGSAIVFPAHLHHRVTPVTRGTGGHSWDGFWGPRSFDRPQSGLTLAFGRLMGLKYERREAQSRGSQRGETGCFNLWITTAQ